MNKKYKEKIKGFEKTDTDKYIGVKISSPWAGRRAYGVSFQHDNVIYSFGRYKDPKECAKAYDLFVIRKGLKRETNFFKKK
ncbi:MAG: hypothetical protein ACO393_05995 [Methylophilaceae bacterium]